MRRALRLVAAVITTVAAVTAAAPRAAANARVILISLDGAGAGLNDPTPVAPVGGNTGTTLGQQRMNALRHAADIWGATLDSPVPIRIQVGFAALTCTATAATLASAGALWAEEDFPAIGAFPGPVAPNVWHHGALANKRAGASLVLDSNGAPVTDDIRARFNINLGTANCLAGSPFYLGLDGNEGTGVDLVATALHEFGHGLGFSQFANLATGALFFELPDVYNRELLDTTLGLTWDQMTDVQRAASAINSRHVVWTGAEVFAAAPSVLQAGTPMLQVNAPAGIAGVYQVGTAAFGPALTAAGITGNVVAGLDAADAAGPSTTDACSPLTNAGAIAGRIALVDRGTCGFTIKVKHAQDAGAIAVIVADNVAGSPPAGLGGTDPAIVIPSVRITLADGDLIKTSLGAADVNVTLTLDLSLLAGADSEGRVYVNAPNPVVPGSSISHWDPLAARNLLMEPNINKDLTHSLQPPADLTLPQMRDIGWFPDADNDGIQTSQDACPAAYDARAKLVVGGTDTGVANLLFSNGCTIQDLVNNAAAAADNHGAFVSSVTHLVNALRDAGHISNVERQAVHRAAAHSDSDEGQ